MNTISILGILIIPISIILLFQPIKYSIGLVLVSTIFQAASVFTIAGNSISPLLFCCAALVLKQCLDWMYGGRVQLIRTRWAKYYMLFLLAALLITMISPALFGNELVIVSTRPVRYSQLSVVAQGKSLSNMITLIAYGFALYIMAINRAKVENEYVMKCFKLSLIIVLLTGFTEFYCRYTGIFDSFWNALIYSKTDTTSIEALYSSKRLLATFMEASYCGGYLAPALIAIFVTFGIKRNTVPVLLILAVATLLNQSSTGLAIVGISLGGYFLLTRNINNKILLPIIFIVGIGIMLLFGYGDVLLERIIFKRTSSSGVQRSALNASCLSIFWNTKLLGAGLNNIRGSSFILSLLGQVGAIGTGLFTGFLVSLVKFNNNKSGALLLITERSLYRSFSFIFLICVLLGMFLSEPDLFLSTFWLAVMMVALMK